jgi:hypothetical protein
MGRIKTVNNCDIEIVKGSSFSDRKIIQFNEVPSIILIPSRKDLFLEDYLALWWSRQEFRSFKDDCSKELQQFIKKNIEFSFLTSYEVKRYLYQDNINVFYNNKNLILSPLSISSLSLPSVRLKIKDKYTKTREETIEFSYANILQSNFNQSDWIHKDRNNRSLGVDNSFGYIIAGSKDSIEDDDERESSRVECYHGHKRGENKSVVVSCSMIKDIKQEQYDDVSLQNYNYTQDKTDHTQETYQIPVINGDNNSFCLIHYFFAMNLISAFIVIWGIALYQISKL